MVSSRTEPRRKPQSRESSARAARALPSPAARQADAARIQIKLLGGFQVLCAGAPPIGVSSRKAEALLALLALRPGAVLARSKLCGLLWPDVPEGQARHSLRQTLLHLRKALPAVTPPLLRADARSLALDAERVLVDVARLEQQLERGTREALEQAATLYGGDLLEGVSVGEAPFEEWLTYERERLRAAAIRGLEQLVDLRSEAGDLDGAAELAARLLQLDPLSEPAHRRLIRLNQRRGRRDAALQQYKALEHTLRTELDTLPDAESQRLHAELQRPRALPAHTAAALELPESAALLHEPTTPLIGRASELQTLRARFAEARAGKATVALLRGEAGVGKTRLCDRLASELASAGAFVARGRCFESEQVLPFSLWTNVLRASGALAQPALLEALSPVLRRELSWLAPELDLCASQGPTPAPDVGRLFQAVQALLSRSAGAGALVLVLEDLHWADEMSLRLLCFLSRPYAGLAVPFVLASAREEELGRAGFLRSTLAELERERSLCSLCVEPFSRADTEALVRSSAGPAQARLTGEVVAQIWAISAGNPLVIVECVRAWHDGSVEAEVERLPVPERVRALILGRVARLTQEARELLSLAAALGREPVIELLRCAVSDEQVALTALEELVDAQLLRLSAGRVSFTHDRVRETVYQAMLPARRQLMHARVAAALEQHAGDNLDDVLGHLGYHHSKAGHAARAVSYLMRFSERASQSYGLGEALGALEQAARDAAQLPPAEHARCALEIALLQAQCLAFLGRFPELLERLREQQQHLVTLDRAELSAPFHFWFGFAQSLMGQRREAEQHGQLSLDHALRCANKRMIGYAHALLSYLCGVGGRAAQGIRHGLTATELLSRVDGMPEASVIAWINLTICYTLSGDWKNALATAERAHAIAQAMDSKRGQSLAATGMAMVHAHTHEWELGLDACRRALSTSRDPFTLVHALTMLGRIQAGSGQAQQAIALLEPVVAKVQQHDMRGLSALAQLGLAEAHLCAGSITEAERRARAVLQLARSTDDVSARASALRVLGQAAQAQGRFTRARRCLSAALSLFEATEAPLPTGETLVALAELALAETDRATARAQLARARALFADSAVQRAVERIDALDV